MITLKVAFILFNLFTKSELSSFLDSQKVDIVMVQQNQNKGYFSLIEKELIDFIKTKKDSSEYYKITSKSLYFANNESIFNVIKENRSLFRYFLENIIDSGKKLDVLTKYSKIATFSLKTESDIRELLSKYLILNGIEKSNTPFFKLINSIHENNRIKYKEDELYIQAIIPLLAERYHKEDFKYYKKFLNTENRVMIETLLYSIPITGDKDFIDLLKSLEESESISIPLKKALIQLTPKELSEEIDLLP
ncbi:hypothetical protein JXR93_06390 [bacterium]|nr:hypothetical protein [bacterium]